jgi:hypothetical protein
MSVKDRLSKGYLSMSASVRLQHFFVCCVLVMTLIKQAQWRATNWQNKFGSSSNPQTNGLSAGTKNVFKFPAYQPREAQ